MAVVSALFLIAFVCTHHTSQLLVSSTYCPAAERQALVELKTNTIDPAGRLSSWSGTDCCQWDGVGCDNQTGHVVSVDLGNFLESNPLSGTIPLSITNLSSLEHLVLYGNSFYGSIPRSLWKLSLLQELDLSANRLTGIIPQSLGQLSKLYYLDLSDNSLAGVVTESHFAGLAKLQVLRMSNNSMLNLKISSGWQPPFVLSELMLAGCRVGPQFPGWLRGQWNITSLDLSNAWISDSLPDWFWSTRFYYLNLSDNKIRGRMPRLLLVTRRTHVTIDLHSNLFEGPLPVHVQNVDLLDLSDNRFTGAIPPQMASNSGRYLLLSNNNLTGTIPSSFCGVTMLFVLDLSGNHLKGQLPNCSTSQYLYILDVSNNNLSGDIPEAFLNSTGFKSLYLSSNSFTGEVPTILKQSKYMSVLDLGNNRFRGHVPIWLDESFTRLRILRLCSNMLTGSLPTETLSRVPNLQILDLSHNNLSGVIPKSFGNLTAMMHQNDQPYDTFIDAYTNNMLLDIKGRELEYANLLRFLVAIDLSDNNFSGAIPKGLRNLSWLQSLNVSGNHLTGEITAIIGGMQRLESLDLSRNELSGPLPQSLGNLNSLGFLNVSYNNFSGRIPSGGHIDTFFDDPSVYMGNPYLDSVAPAENSHGNQTDRGENEEDDNNRDEMFWLYAGLAPGFAVALCILYGVLAFKETWRRAYFQTVDSLCDFLYVKAVIHLRKLRRIGRVHD